MIFGVDPGAAFFGLVAIQDGVVVKAKTLRGGTTPANDWNVTAPVITRMSKDAWTWIEDAVGEETEPYHVAAESYVYIGGRVNVHFWKGPAVCGAFGALAPHQAWLHWQTSTVVLGPSQYGPVKDLLRTGSLPKLDPGKRIGNEHTASAACHALYREAICRQTRLI